MKKITCREPFCFTGELTECIGKSYLRIQKQIFRCLHLKGYYNNNHAHGAWETYS